MDALLFTWNRPRSFWDVWGVHFPFALASGILLFVPRWISHDCLPLIRCTFLWLTGYPCPFCGFTRSFAAMFVGDWRYAVYNSPLACMAYITLELIFAWNVAALLLRIRLSRGRLFRLRPGFGPWLFGIVGTLVVLNWLYRLSLGLK